MRKVILGFLLISAGCAIFTRTQDRTSRNPAADYGATGVGTAPLIPKDQILSFAAFKNLILTQKIKTIEEALAPLNTQYKEYLNFHTLMYNSLSLQESSFANPRAIVFGPDARFVFSFNGNSQQRGGTSFETMEYSTQEHRFLFREIAFKSPGFDSEMLGLAEDEIDYQDASVVISKSNPGKCAQCHGANFSPIWMTYFLWPGAYGSNDDQLSMSFDKGSWNDNNGRFFRSVDRPQSQGRQMKFKEGAKDTEYEAYANYVRQKPLHPRFRFLPPRILDFGVLAFAKGSFANADVSKLVKKEKERLQTHYAWPSRPNLFLQAALMEWNQDRLIAKLDSEGLRGILGISFFRKIDEMTGSVEADPSKEFATLAGQVQRLISYVKFKASPPSLGKIEAMIRANVLDEIGLEREKTALHQNALGGHDLRFFESGERTTGREAWRWIPDPEAYYKNILGLKEVSETDRIAFNLDTDDQVFLTALQIVLLDRGIDLHDYNMNLRQLSISFHTGGIAKVVSYLTGPPPN